VAIQLLDEDHGHRIGGRRPVVSYRSELGFVDAILAVMKTMKMIQVVDLEVGC
jgi:hypothetical protein